MSRGLGRIERAIIAFVDDEDWYEDAYAAESLAIALYHPKLPLDGGPPVRSVFPSFGPCTRLCANTLIGSC